MRPLAKKKKAIFLIGITGGIGSGKSAVAKMFSRFGVSILFADDISKEICAADAVVRKKLSAVLGPEAYDGNGNLNRTFVASRIFSDRTVLKKVEVILHPAVHAEIKRLAARLEEAGQRMAFVEAALVYESGMDKYLDAVIVVDAEESVRLRRVEERDHAAGDVVKARMRAQIDSQKKIAKGDYVLYNNGSLKELEEKVRMLFSVFQKLTSEE
jgi:dephospho-CoA kinase